MKSLGELFANLFSGVQVSAEERRIKNIYREWDKQRANAYGPSDRAEIDAIFARALEG